MDSVGPETGGHRHTDRDCPRAGEGRKGVGRRQAAQTVSEVEVPHTAAAGGENLGP